MRWGLFLLTVLFSASLHAMQCAAKSPERTTALVELYTSEGCDSCPLADRWLSSLGARGYAPDRVVPIALHVDYWDYIGWKDPYAQQRFSSRQRKLAQLTRSAIVYTPQVILQGRDFRGWSTGAFDEAVSKINAQPARARIELKLDTRGKGVFQAGENRGRTLAHDFVVFEWARPLEFKGAARLTERRSLPLLPKAVPGHSGVVAFVQNRSSAEVLQALMLPACPG